MTRSPLHRLVAAGLALALLGTACGSDDDATGDDSTTTAAAAPAVSDEDATAVATSYADLVFASYSDVVDATTQMQSSIEAFVAEPTDTTLQAAKDDWLAARDLYGPTEVFRFYDGPIDNPDTGPEGQINAWPLDEAYVDYVEGDPDTGIVNDTAGYPEISTDVVTEANEQGGEENISTGWHAIEFLLWGQDLSESGAGDRPVTDYTTSPVAERRAEYLTVVTDLLVADLTSVRDAWDPEATDGYRAEFVEDPQQAVTNILEGMGALSKGELGGERILVAYDTEDQEDEHSCFSDNTHNDVIGNATGIRMAYTLEGLDGFDGGTSLSSVVAEIDPTLDESLRDELDANVAAAEALETPFDQLIVDDEARESLRELGESLQAQGDTVADVAGALGLQISLEI